MKKRILALLLITCMLLSLGAMASCTVATNKKISRAMKKTENLDSYHANMRTTVTMSFVHQGQNYSQSVPVIVDMKVEDAKTESPKISADIITSVSGKNTVVETYVEGDWIYINSGEQKFKQNLNENINDRYKYTENIDSLFVELPDDLLESAVLTEDENGETATIEIPKNLFKRIFKDVIDEAYKSLPTSATMNVNDAVVKITMNDGYVTVYEVSYIIILEIDGINAAAKAISKIVFKNPGEKISVTPLEGYQEYHEKK